MKKLSKVLTGLAATAMVVSLVMPVQAVDYNFTFKLLAGAQGEVAMDSGDGKFEGEAEVVFTASTVSDNNPQGGTVTVTDKTTNKTTSYTIRIPSVAEGGAGKYYVKGIKKSGRDQILAKETITKDADYVVAYGVMKNPVEYTVLCVDATNHDHILASRTYLASVGDRPVIACDDIDGYMPDAYNKTKTLTANAADNIIPFYYWPMPTTPGGVVTNEETENVTNTTTQIVPGEGGAGGGALLAPEGGGDAGAGAGAGGEAAGEGAGGGEQTPPEPQELVDLDDEEVPLANLPGGGQNAVGSEQGSFFVNMPPAVIVGVVSMALIAVAAAWYFLFMKKKRAKEGNEEK